MFDARQWRLFVRGCDSHWFWPSFFSIFVDVCTRWVLSNLNAGIDRSRGNLAHRWDMFPKLWGLLRASLLRSKACCLKGFLIGFSRLNWSMCWLATDAARLMKTARCWSRLWRSLSRHVIDDGPRAPLNLSKLHSSGADARRGKRRLSITIGANNNVRVRSTAVVEGGDNFVYKSLPLNRTNRWEKRYWFTTLDGRIPVERALAVCVNGWVFAMWYCVSCVISFQHWRLHFSKYYLILSYLILGAVLTQNENWCN